METISRNSTYKKEKDYVIWFRLSNGKTYYIGEGFVFLSIREGIPLEVLKSTARKYSYMGAKRIHTMLWNKYFTTSKEKENGGFFKSIRINIT
jgi:hypothetical protein